MPNFICLHKPSQLIKSIVASSSPPIPDSHHVFYNVSGEVLTKYYRLLTKARRKGLLVSSGDLAAVSPSFLESLIEKAIIS